MSEILQQRLQQLDTAAFYQMTMRLKTFSQIDICYDNDGQMMFGQMIFGKMTISQKTFSPKKLSQNLVKRH